MTPLEAGYCHVELTADVSAMRTSAIGGTAAATGFLGVGAAGTAAILATTVIFPFFLFAAIPLAAAVAAPVIGSRIQKQRGAQMVLALEQVLDRLEHGGIKPKHVSAGQPFLKLADEIRKAITDGIESKHRRLKP